MTLYVVMLGVFVFVCFALILVVLLQSGRGASLAGAFGGGGSGQTVFGSRGAATFLTRLTTWLAALYMILALLLGISSPARRPASVIERELVSEEAASPPAAQEPLPIEQVLEPLPQEQQGDTTAR
jgi:preprotein translocase subunit SecG